LRPPAFASAGRWLRGNLHTHSDRSDGVVPPERVLADYRAAGYDFLVLTDHFEARWGWTVTDTSAARDDGFTTLLGAELSSADWDDEDVFWVNAIGLPADFAAPASPHEHADAIRRAAEAGAYNVLLHPGLTNLLDFERLPLEHLHAVETYNQNAAIAWPDRPKRGTRSTPCSPVGTGCTSPSATTPTGIIPGTASPRGWRFARRRSIPTRSWTR
jgi:hypothetical protein